MTTSLDGSVVPVRYYQALDPYNWKVDNRPLKDLEDNQEVLMSGIETALNTSKVGASTVSAVLQACFSTGVVVGDYSLAGPGLKVLLVNCVLPGSASEDGRQVKTIGVQYDYEEFVFSAPASGNKKLITLSAKYLLADDSLMPYYDQTQILDALAMDLATSQIKYGTIDFTVTSNEVTNSAPNTYPSPPLGDLVLLNIKIEDSDTVIQAANVTVVSLVKTGQPVRQASQAQYGQVKFATPAEITAGTATDRVVSVENLATRALSQGDENLTFKVADGVVDEDAVNLGQLNSAVGGVGGAFTEVLLTPTTVESEIIVPNTCKRIEVLLIAQGGGGGGGACTSSGGGGGGGGSPGQVIEFMLYPAQDPGASKSIDKLVVYIDTAFGTAGLGGVGGDATIFGAPVTWTAPGSDGYDGGDLYFRAMSYADGPYGFDVFWITAKGGKKGRGSTGTAGGLGAAPTTTAVERSSFYQIDGTSQKSSVGGPNYVSSYTGRAGDNGQSTSALPSVPQGGTSSTLTGGYIHNTYTGDSRGRGGAGGDGTLAVVTKAGDGLSGGQPLCRIRFHYR